MSKIHTDILKRHKWKMHTVYAMGERAYTEHTTSPKTGAKYWRKVQATTYYYPHRFVPIGADHAAAGWSVVRLYKSSKKFKWAILDANKKIVKAVITVDRKITCPTCERKGMKCGKVNYIRAKRFSTPARAIEAAMREARLRKLANEHQPVIRPTPPMVEPRKSLLQLAKNIIAYRSFQFKSPLLRPMGANASHPLHA